MGPFRLPGLAPRHQRQGVFSTLISDAGGVIQSVANEVVNPVVAVIDVNGVVERVDIDAVVERVDLDAVVECVDIQGLSTVSTCKSLSSASTSTAWWVLLTLTP
jgi:hypothetical protein